MRTRGILFWITALLLPASGFGQHNALVFQSDFGLKDGAVAAMKGVAFSVSANLRIFDITHEIPPYDIWSASYRLNQTAVYWPKGTVFVSVVDPGVGTARKSVVVKTLSGHFVVTPDNGTLTHIAESLGIQEVREIDETRNRRRNSEQSYTFHGRDVYAYTGARLAAGVISFEEVGPRLSPDIIRLPYEKAAFKNGEVSGIIPVLDTQYGNVWTNIDDQTFQELGTSHGSYIRVRIYHGKDVVYDKKVLYGKTFSDVAVGAELGYMNSLLNFSLGINEGSFADRYHIQSGGDWRVVVGRE